MPHPLTAAAYARFCAERAAKQGAMAEFIESHGIAVDKAKLSQGYMLIPYWDQIEAKLVAAKTV